MAKHAIWKFPLADTDEQVIVMPAGSKVLTVQVQHGITCMWALCSVERDRVGHLVRIVGTGHPCDAMVVDVLRYAGTYQLHDGDLVFHVFVEETK